MLGRRGLIAMRGTMQRESSGHRAEARRRPLATNEEANPAQHLAALTDDERRVLLKVAEILRKIEFGTVVLVVQDGKVVQIEMAEKFRLR